MRVVLLKQQMVGTLENKILVLRSKGIECTREPVKILGSLLGIATTAHYNKETVKIVYKSQIENKCISTYDILLMGKCS